MGLRTPLHDTHVAAGARMVDFGGWDMPVNYGSQIDEHHAVRRDAGMFDVSHMCVLDLTGVRVREFLRYLLANDVAKLKTPGKALYSCLLNECGGVIDDLIVYHLIKPGMTESWFRVVVNAGTRDKDIAWIKQHAVAFNVDVNVRTDLAMIAVQGPNACAKAVAVLGADTNSALELKVFAGGEFGRYFIGRTGYTGEDGFEVMLPADQAAAVWVKFTAAGITQCGLGARDTLRLEAGMNLYGNDMDESQSPLESGLTWTIAFEPKARNFIGRAALEAQQHAGVPRKMVGLLLEERGVLRSHQMVLVEGQPNGEITSGTFSPTLERSIALARVPVAAEGNVKVDIRGKQLAARIVPYPFARHGKACIEI
ncbi:MAG: glycine cleavage system aminomethyltransferase GcvT [Steroidobacteraceae bacterium]